MVVSLGSGKCRQKYTSKSGLRRWMLKLCLICLVQCAILALSAHNQALRDGHESPTLKV